MDLNINYPILGSSAPEQQTQKYYYVVTAVRGNEESPYSNENVALPNYKNGASPPLYKMRFDPDNEGDIACDDEMSAFEPEGDVNELQAMLVDESRDPGSATVPAPMLGEDHFAPYRVIGAKDPSQGGGGGNPAPSAVSRWLFYHTDHLGNPRVITDAAGALVSTHHMMPFGEEKPIPNRVSSNAMMFTGHERDTESASSDNPDGLDYMLARYYSSSLGRFMAVDPGDDTQLEDPASWNKYSYVRNNPLVHRDPDGRKLKVKGNKAEKKKRFDEITQNLTDKEKSAVKLKRNGKVKIEKGAEGTSNAFKDLSIIIGVKENVTVNTGQSVEYMKGSAQVSEDLKPGGGGTTVPANQSLTGDIEVHIDPRGNKDGAPASLVMSHELFGHALDYVRTGVTSERSAIIEETKILGDQGKPPYRETPDE